MNPLNPSRRSFLNSALALAGTAPLMGRQVQAQSAPAKGPLLAYVGTFSSPLRDVVPTQVDLPPGNGRGPCRRPAFMSWAPAQVALP